MPGSPVRGRRLTALGIALALLPSLGAVTASATQTGAHTADTALPAGVAIRKDAGVPRTITLINGDKVTVTGAGKSAVTSLEDPEGRPVSAYSVTHDGETFVYPQEVLPYVSAGILDEDLFNVTRLLADGYDDTRSDHLPLIVRYADAARARSAASLPQGAVRLRTLTSLQGAAVAQKRDEAGKFWDALTKNVNTSALARSSTLGGAVTSKRAPAPLLAGGIQRVWLDGKVKADLADSVAQIGAPEAWESGDTGQGVDVAVLDTGVDAGHPDLVGQVAAAESFVPDESVVDHHGHGTHVASTIAGTGAASEGKEKGVAPGARLHVGKVLGNSGAGQTSWILAGMEWAVRDQHAKVVSMSLGGEPTDGTDPMSEAVNTLSAETGALFAIAAGNTGPRGAVSSPAVADAALAVGAVDSADRLASFSSRGPRVGDGALKPEITAPGVGVLAARSQHAPGEGSYTTMSGTSMATPHVAGAAALVAAAHPGWTGQQIKDVLVSTTKATPDYSAYDAGNGRLDAAAAAKAEVYATGVVDAVQEWPPTPGVNVDRKVTYTNDGDTPVTLDLAVEAGKAPSGLFTLSAPGVTVPAHGTAAVTVTAHPDRAEEAMLYNARIEAADGGSVKLATAFGLVTTYELHDLTIAAKDRSGKPVTGDFWVVLQQGKRPGITMAGYVSGSTTVSMYSGPWSVVAAIPVEGAHGPHSRGLALVADPEFRLEEDATLTFDASKTRRVTAVTPKESVTTYMRVDYKRTLDASGTHELSFYQWPTYDSVWALPTGEKVAEGALTMRTRWRNEQPPLKLASRQEAVDDILVRRGATPLHKGTSRLDAVYAGQGAAADYKGLRVSGKAAVVVRNDTVTASEQVAAAAAAGAKLLIVVNDGDGRLDPRTQATPPLTVVAVGKDQGDRLIRRASAPGGSELKMFSNPTTEYLYDLADAWEGAVPADTVYRPAAKDLARIDVAFKNYRQADARETRYAVWPDAPSLRVDTELPRPARGTRTDWVSTGSGVRWAQAATVLGEIRILAPPRTYKAGTTTSDEWFAPVTRPRINTSFPGTFNFRQDDLLFVNVPGWGDAGTRREGYALTPDARATASLYQGDTLLNSSSGTFTVATGLKPERQAYRYVLETARGAWGNPFSTATRTEWDFTSAAGAQYEGRAVALIQLDYAVHTDRDGRARRDASLTVTAEHPPTSDPGQDIPPSSAIGKVGLELSYDNGKTWHKANVTRKGDGWRTTLDAPRKASHVTVRATAADDRGNAVQQTITRAFGLR
ncbi:S8 family serine peptidase [Actinacidiphila glaucinigra]|uniref:S8 family serine peptidase n=1 Tax=Actinacidiphila glaucinigra TaxID=235986 RepID=UPI0029AB4C49|nr:S8 family serine peptidase [Streptomyces sp. PA03-3a]